MLIFNKIFNKKISKKHNKSINTGLVDNSVMKIIIFASALIVLAIFLMGILSYKITKDELIKKLKSRDLIYIVQSINAKIDGRISRAKETSLLLAGDPSIIQWLKGYETDETLGSIAKQKITDLAKKYDYDNSNIVSALTNHYWSEGGKLMDIMSKTDPDDSWFFETINSKIPVDVQIDFNNERNDTFAFIDALIGDINNPIGVASVGINLRDISEEFKSYKFGNLSNLWLIDNKGKIYLSEDAEQSGKNILEFIEPTIVEKIIDNKNNLDGKEEIFEYKNNNGEIFDVITDRVKSTQWKLVFQVPREESISIVNSIKINTISASLISIILIICIFYLISSKISNPYKRAVVLSQELEKKVNERTKELNEKNEKLIDSIEYASIIQESILPPAKDLKSIFKEYFILWKPKDIVGGDFYFIKAVNGGYIIAIGDCTGHGVPGALMTMTVNSILNHIIDEICHDNPAQILSETNKRFKQTLKGRNHKIGIDDGLDAAIIYVSNKKLIYAGAKIPLYKKDCSGVSCFKGNNKGIGYKNISDDIKFDNIEINFEKDDIFYLATDGFTDQNGGEKDFSFGRKRLEQIINNYSHYPLEEQQHIFNNTLKEYMDNEPQRDDITVIAFKP